MAVAGILLSQSSCLVLKKKYDEQVALADKMKAERDDCNDKLNQANATIDDLNKVEVHFHVWSHYLTYYFHTLFSIYIGNLHILDQKWKTNK